MKHKNYIYFVNGKSVWSDRDYSESDGTPYYEAHKDIEVGYPCRLVDGKIVKFTDAEYAAFVKANDKSQELAAKNTKALIECNSRIQTIPAEVRLKLGLSNRDKHYSGDNWINFYSMCQTFLIESKAGDQYAKWVLNRIQTLYKSYKDMLVVLDGLSMDDLKKYNVKDDAHWDDIPLPMQ